MAENEDIHGADAVVKITPIEKPVVEVVVFERRLVTDTYMSH